MCPIHPMVGNKHKHIQCITIYTMYIVIVWYCYMYILDVEYGVLEHCVCEILQC